MDEMDDVKLRLFSLRRRLWAQLMQYADRMDLERVSEILDLIKAVDKI